MRGYLAGDMLPLLVTPGPVLVMSWLCDLLQLCLRRNKYQRLIGGLNG